MPTWISATIVLAASASALAADRPDPLAADIAWVASGEFCEPETVLPLPDDTLLVSNVCDFRERGNGFLTLLDKNGEALDWRVVEGLDSPLGMTLVDGRLYVVDSNRLVVMRWPGYERLETINLDTVVANDVAVTPDGVAYVTDTADDKVLQRLPDGTQSVLTGEAQFKGANGIALKGEYLFVGGARLWRLDLRKGHLITVGPDWLADIDGIEFEANGTVQITPVAGPLIRYRGDDEIEILAGEGVSSANHGYAPELELALIPTGFDNTVIAIRLGEHRD